MFSILYYGHQDIRLRGTNINIFRPDKLLTAIAFLKVKNPETSPRLYITIKTQILLKTLLQGFKPLFFINLSSMF